jgi:hypothetical protein
MHSTASLSLGAFALTLLSTTASAGTVVLFGTRYDVQRFDYKQQIQWTNPVPPGNQLGLIRIEGAWWLGGNHMLVSTSHQDQSVPTTYANFVLEVQANTDAQQNVTGFSYVRTVVANDPALLGSPFDLRAGGMVINPTATGIAANGNLMVADGGSAKKVRAYDWNTGVLLPYGPTGDGVPFSPPMFDLTDIALSVEGAPSTWRLWGLDESSKMINSFTLDGTPISSFPVAILANPAALNGDPKGLVYLSDVSTWPAAFHGQGGVLLMSMGDAGPGLQAFRQDGTEIGYEPIDNTVFVTSTPANQPKIESIAADPATGRLFMYMEKGSLVDNWVWVLTPDCNGNTIADAVDIQSGAVSDFNVDGVPDACQLSGQGFCFGDGSGTACPCANNSSVGAGAGCLNSLGTGAKLDRVGTPSLSADSIALLGDGMPSASALYFQGTAQVNAGSGASFGDGLRCVGGTIVRLKTVTNVGGASHYPGAGDASVSVRGQITAPGTYHYQTWYRNAASFCTSSTFNLSNALTLTWTP